MGFKKILFGEKVPDKDDPKYKERYERDVAAGKSFAQTLHLDKGAACVQRFASKHTKLFLALVFSFVLFSVGLSLYRMTQAVKYRPQPVLGLLCHTPLWYGKSRGGQIELGNHRVLQRQVA